ncbi:MAG: hypothetical protein KKB95_09405 [Gammaproteobacteria bacterium]|nr:hypothetical protein [Gammaproteobacteria bacterium]MBU1505777.1 hypothetical protein [Gammaproteobacteria bacterium]MBU2119465.1 hypothetical protein [Gammaproteobacteria bacterium]MBU2172629.1 hypothetical protein [Gammaproteobacteria bacterium]MBU2202087.1 hypothetical protein [Gammaproteobacteria bacterium]
MAVVLASVAFWAAAKLILVGDLGKPINVDFKVRFRRLKTSERKQLEAELAEKKITDKQFLDRLALDWELKDLQGSNVVYSEQVRAEMVEDWDGLEASMVTAYFDNGRKARQAAEVAKNSEEPSATT